MVNSCELVVKASRFSWVLRLRLVGEGGPNDELIPDFGSHHTR